MPEITPPRRRFLKTAALGVGALAASSFPAPAIAKGLREWKMVMTWQKQLPGLGTGAVRLAERITRLSEGRLKVTPFGAGELVPAFGCFDAVAQGTAEMAHGGAYYWLSKNRSFAFFCAVPGGLTAQEHNAWLYFGDGLQLMHELYRPFGIISFPAGNTGTQMGGWYKKPLNSLADIEGLKMRIPGLAGEVFALLGGNPLNIPGSEIFTALQSGVIDATEWVGPWNDMALGFHKVAPYYYGPAFQEGGPMLDCMINLQAYESLPEELKQVVKTACATENQLMLSEFQFNNLRAFGELRKDKSVHIGTYPQDILSAFFNKSQEVLAETAELGAINRRIYESYAAFRTMAVENSPVSEYGFMRARMEAK